MNNLFKQPGGYVEATLGERTYPSKAKNSLSHSSISKSSVVNGWGDYVGPDSGKVGKVGRAAKFPENFIGAGFCDG